ncbi:MAG: hypothetical protein IKE03_06390 [Blautia sp.]|nr:hypothetical protein [Blautia sp.]
MKKLTAILCAVAMVAATCVTSFAKVSIGPAGQLENGGKATNVSAIGITLPAEGIIVREAKATDYPDGSKEDSFVEAFESEKTLADALAKVDFTAPMTTDGGKTVDPKTVKLLTSPLVFANAVTGEVLKGDGKLKITFPGNENTKGKDSDKVASVQMGPDGTIHVVDMTVDKDANTLTAIFPCIGPFVIVGL